MMFVLTSDTRLKKLVFETFSDPDGTFWGTLAIEGENPHPGFMLTHTELLALAEIIDSVEKGR